MSVSVEELAQRAGAVVEQVTSSRRHTLITDHGRPVAAIVPLGEATTLADELAELLNQEGLFADVATNGSSVVDEFLSERRIEAARDNEV